MKRCLLCLLFALLIAPSSLISQPTLSLSQGFLMLKEELRLSLQSLNELDKQVTILQNNLEEAKKSQVVSEQRIADLESSLLEAMKQRDQLQSRVQLLGQQLTELSTSLQNSKELIKTNEEAHLADLETLSSKYERQVKVLKILLWCGVAVIVVEAGVIAYQAVTSQ